jgi:hypothetical protein
MVQPLDELTDFMTSVSGVPSVTTAASIVAALDALRAKYPQYQETPILQDPPTLLAFAPTRFRSWCAGPLAP